MSSTILEILKTSIYVSIPILLIVLLKDRILSRYSPKVNYIICTLITLRMMFITKIEISLPFEKLNNISNKLDSLEKIVYTPKNNSNMENLLNLMFYIWIIGAVIVLISNIHKQISFYKKMKNIKYRVEDKNILKVLEIEKLSLSIQRNIKVFKVDGLSSPALIGFINSKIIIPNKDYTKEELKWIFRHELIHYRRKDNLLKLLLMIASVIYWFNPLVKVLNKYFKEQCELSCDEQAVEAYSKNHAKNYALVLVNSLRYRNTLKSTLCSSQFNSDEIDLIKSRVEKIVNSNSYKNGTGISIFLAMITIISTLSINIITNQNTVYASSNTATIDFKVIENEFVNHVMGRLTEEEKQQVKFVRDKDNIPTIIVGDSKSFSINKKFLMERLNN